MEVRGVEQELIPYVEQLKLPNVAVEEWIIDPDIHSHCHYDGLLFPTYNGEVVHPGMMACGDGMIIDGGKEP